MPITRLARTVLFVLALTGSEASLAWAQTYTVLYSFTGAEDGAYPTGGLTLDSAGNLYGTTYGYDGYFGSGTTAGSVFEVSSAGHFTLLHNFGAGGAEGAWPFAGLVRDSSGNLYGTTSGGGSSSRGTVFKLDNQANLGVLHSFAGGKDRARPFAPLILDPAGNLYGTTADGGTADCIPAGVDSRCGTVFEIPMKGRKAGKEKILHRFSSSRKLGSEPHAPVMRDSAGNLFGTDEYDGPGEGGTVFELGAQGGATVRHTFSTQSNEYFPLSGLMQDGAGNLYGTTTGGPGIVYRLDPQGNETVLFSFEEGAGGASPLYSGVIMDVAGNLYGTTYAAGNENACLNLFSQGCGVVYKLDPSGNETVVYTFSGGTDGANPQSGVIMDAAGNLYGTTSYGGIVNSVCPAGCGVVFKITPQ
jgi:uncharacterized repeat protein (TIGR03803 family)